MSGAAARFERLTRRHGAAAALTDFTLDVAPGELIAVVGPSGCGKSTLLRCTAGLDAPTSGHIALDGVRIDDLPPPARDVAMVFQSYALYPHLTVRQNVEFPLRMRRVPRAERAARVDEVAALLELAPLLDRRPAALSGGQRQRVALARAVVRRPRLFLLDEPLSNLDARLRASVRQWLRALQRRLGTTTLLVTHDQTEALTLGDRVVVLDRGRIQQVGAPLAVYERPANAFVAGFMGTPPMSLVPATCVADGLRVGAQVVRGPCGMRLEAGRAVRVGVRPEAFAPGDGGGLVAVVDPAMREVLGSETVVGARVGDAPVLVRLFGTVHALPERVVAPPDALHVFDDASGVRLGP